MINVEDKKKCVGCRACEQICPQNCITMVEDDEGFIYPEIDETKCINCGLCERVCPMNQTKGEIKEPLKCYLAKNKDKILLKESTSGGVFSALATSVLEDNGVVFGAMYDSEMKVIHSYITRSKELVKLRGSKYVQSDIGNCYAKVKELLNAGKKVLFSGTPCQISGLKKFLIKDYDNLITCDFICTGVPSPKIFRNIVFSKQKKLGAKIIDVDFRNKKYGWIDFGFEFITNQKQKSDFNLRYNDPYILNFYNHTTIRPACYDCKFKKQESQSDIKLADSWTVKKQHSEFYDYYGSSYVMINTPKGIDIFEKIKEKLEVLEIEYDEILENNLALTKISVEPENRKEIFKKINSNPDKTEQILKENTNNKKYNKIKLKVLIKKIIYSIKK